MVWLEDKPRLLGYVETARGEDSQHDQEGRGKKSIGQKKGKEKRNRENKDIE